VSDIQPLAGVPEAQELTTDRGVDPAAVDLAVFAWEWTRVLAGTSWVAEDRTVVADRLTRLTSRLAGALRAEPFAPEAGIEVGEALVRFGYVAPDALARTVTLLQERPLADLRPAGTAAGSTAAEGRLAQLVGAVCLGFTRALRNRTLDEQEAIRSSALLAWQRAEAALREQALHDPLTGLPNRAGFARDLEPMTAHGTTGTVTACLLVVTDLPAVDDVAGREVGDAVLRGLAERLRSRYDGPSELVAHVGREEFIVAAVDHHDGTDTTGLRLAGAQELLSAPVYVDGQRFVVSVAAGLVARPAGRTDAARLLRDADRAASWARSRGRDAVAIFDGARDAREAHDRELAADLPAAIDSGGLAPHYQPIVAPATGRLVAVEMLARWPHPRQGLVPPSRFLRLAERGGLSEALGRSLLRQACRQAAAWRASLAAPPVVSVNVFPMQLAGRHTPGAVAEVLDEAGLPAPALQVEISEQSVLSDPRVLRGIADLAALGVHVVVDDFGTGRANVAQLAELPEHGVRGIKLPADFLTRIGPDGSGCHDTTAGRAVRVLAGTVDLAHDLGLQVTVEGVETAGQHRLVEDLGVDLAQGWHHGRPAAADATTRLLRAQTP
jgi:diguanylate cyclase (GGDEF)-like protein